MSKLNVNLTQKKLSVNINKTGPKGDTGDSAYVYVAYASDDQGTGFSLTPSESLDYIAILSTDTEIASPSAGDFSGLWVRYQTADPDATETLTNKTITSLNNTVYADQVHKAGDNETGISLDKAKAVFASGYNIGQDETEIELADASDDTKMPSIGLTFETIDPSSVGAIARMGAIEGVDTSAYAVGTVLYVSETAGEITDTPPSSAGSWVQPIAYVMRSNAGNGVLAVLENIAYKITPTNDGDIASKKYVDSEKLNKNITDGAENDLLTLESGVWVNKGQSSFRFISDDYSAMDYWDNFERTSLGNADSGQSYTLTDLSGSSDTDVTLENGLIYRTNFLSGFDGILALAPTPSKTTQPTGKWSRSIEGVITVRALAEQTCGLVIAKDSSNFIEIIPTRNSVDLYKVISGTRTLVLSTSTGSLQQDRLAYVRLSFTREGGRLNGFINDIYSGISDDFSLSSDYAKLDEFPFAGFILRYGDASSVISAVNFVKSKSLEPRR